MKPRPRCTRLVCAATSVTGMLRWLAGLLGELLFIWRHRDMLRDWKDD